MGITKAQTSFRKTGESKSDALLRGAAFRSGTGPITQLLFYRLQKAVEMSFAGGLLVGGEGAVESRKRLRVLFPDREPILKEFLHEDFHP